MSTNEAITYMKESKDINDWNTRRDTVKGNFSGKTLVKVLSLIDGVGLCVEVLGADKVN